jgi:hypothetical protein
MNCLEKTMNARQNQYNVELHFWNLTIDLLTNARRLDLTELGQHLAAGVAWAAIGFLIGLLIGAVRLILSI